LAKSLRQTHRAKTTGLNDQLKFASGAEKERLAQQVDILNEGLVSKTRDLFKSKIEKDMDKDKIKEAQKGELVNRLLDTVLDFNSLEDLEKEFLNQATIDRIKELGMKIETIKPLLIERYKHDKTLLRDKFKEIESSVGAPGLEVLFNQGVVNNSLSGNTI